ncbi:MAG: hypothetical protein LKK00_01615 [Intestinimonas sp.]|jgi:hypothetical protein|nr:hypothetical protein [Intestinimonas sp.]
MARRKKTEWAATVVYCGPTVPGVAKQFTIYKGGIPKPLAEAIRKNPAMGGLVIPLDQLPDAMRQLREGSGSVYRLYRLVQAKT